MVDTATSSVTKEQVSDNFDQVKKYIKQHFNIFDITKPDINVLFVNYGDKVTADTFKTLEYIKSTIDDPKYIKVMEGEANLGKALGLTKSMFDNSDLPSDTPTLLVLLQSNKLEGDQLQSANRALKELRSKLDLTTLAVGLNEQEDALNLKRLLESGDEVLYIDLDKDEGSGLSLVLPFASKIINSYKGKHSGLFFFIENERKVCGLQLPSI